MLQMSFINFQTHSEQSQQKKTMGKGMIVANLQKHSKTHSERSHKNGGVRGWTWPTCKRIYKLIQNRTRNGGVSGCKSIQKLIQNRAKENDDRDSKTHSENSQDGRVRGWSWPTCKSIQGNFQDSRTEGAQIRCSVKNLLGLMGGWEGEAPHLTQDQ